MVNIEEFQQKHLNCVSRAKDVEMEEAVEMKF